jgi:hypothetical protein
VLGERLARQALHDEERRAVVVAAHVEHGNHVGVVKPRGRARFLQHARSGLLVTAREQLDRHRAAGQQMLTSVDSAHAAAAEEIVQPIATCQRGLPALVPHHVRQAPAP